ncbi:MAG: hypothetical protein A3I68_04920 [Candidatus Melainabacteria bacterium RIFCSPLOWO2_02_FULL_35_15]|nr:MAG: hypothetical protein A3F80_07120 [Candidatus Melainabacteria bacterium RIFCSPLOWO2_12_FULL_35_11]OGI12797.1 MAG: hypothetical protein A3I68_04920 [Candidatus Melainabacteria bacterium RIFCSPLOWO2_02_FULL_35_15]
MAESTLKAPVPVKTLGSLFMKIKVEKCRQVRIYPLIKGLLSQGNARIEWNDGFIINLKLHREGKRDYIHFTYITSSEGGDKKLCNYKVSLTRTECPTGFRYWLACPLVNKENKACGNRVGILYMPPKRNYFGCRRCHKLIYQRQCLSGLDKKYGKLISFCDLEQEEKLIKRKVYAGFFTQRYMKHLNKVKKNNERFGKRVEDLNSSLLS